MQPFPYQNVYDLSTFNLPIQYSNLVSKDMKSVIKRNESPTRNLDETIIEIHKEINRNKYIQEQFTEKLHHDNSVL